MAKKQTRVIDVQVNSNVGTQMSKGTASAKGLGGALKGVAASASAATGGIRAMTSALIASGVGAFVVVLGSAIGAISGLINKSREFDSALANLSSVTGKSKDDLSALKENAKELGATTAFTATQVLELSTEFAKLGFSTNEIVEASKATLDLAAATGTDLAEAARVSGATLRGFGLDASETGRMADVMAKSFTASALDMNKFSESMKLVAPIAKVTNTTLEESTAALGILADRGVAGSLAGTQLRRIMSDLAQKTGKSFQESLEITADKLSKANSNAEKLAIAKKLVGDRAKGSLIALAENREALAGLALEFDNANGAAEEMADRKLESLDGALIKLGSAWEGFMLSLEDGTGIFGTLSVAIVNATTSLLNFFTATESAVDKIEDQRTALFGLEGQIQKYDKVLADSNATEAERAEAQRERVKAINELISQHPELLKDLDAETASMAEIKDAIKLANQALMDRTEVTKIDMEIEEQAQETREASKEFYKEEKEALDLVNEAKKRFNDLGYEITASSPEEALQQMSEAYDAIHESNKTANESTRVSSEIMGDLRGLKADLGKQIITLKKADEEFAEQTAAGNALLEKRKALVGEVVEETKKATEDEGTGTDAPSGGLSEDELKKLLDSRQTYLDKLTMMEKKAAAKTAYEKIELQREIALKELEDSKLNTTQKREAEKRINDIFDQQLVDKAQEEMDKANADIQKATDIAVNKENERQAKLKEVKDAWRLMSEEDEAKRELMKIDMEEEKALLELEKLGGDQDAKLQIEKYYSDQRLLLAEEEANKKKALEEDVQKAKMQLAIKGLGAVDALVNAFAGKSEKAQKKAFKISKAIRLAQATMSGIEGVQNAYTTAQSSPITKLFPAYPLVQAGIAGAFATAQVATIAKTQFRGSGGGGGTEISSDGRGGGGRASQPPAFNVIGQTSAGDNMIANTIEGANSQPVRAYVVEGEVSNQQELSRKANDMASLG